jgi:hypothetical protein
VLGVQVTLDTTASGRFWLCPVCRKHVPSRNDKCQCGFDRSTVNVAMREAALPSIQSRSEAGAAEGGSSLPWLVGLALAVVASLWLWKAGKDSERANAELRDRTAQRLASQEQAQQTPQVIFVPQPAREEGSTTPDAPPIDPHAGAYAALQEAARDRLAVPPPQVMVVQPTGTGTGTGDVDRNMRAQQEMFWRDKAMRAESQLASTAAAYISAVCKEKLGGVPIAGGGTYNEYRNQYVRALAEAESMKESARTGMFRLAGFRYERTIRHPWPPTSCRAWRRTTS